jgi:hypothetical protein
MPDPTPAPTPPAAPVPPGTLRGIVHAWLATQPLWVRLLFTVALLVLGAVLKHYLGPAGAAAVVVQVADAPTDPQPANVAGAAPAADLPGATGWVDDQDEVARVVATVRQPVFAATPAGQAADAPDEVFQWKMCEAAGYPQLPHDQGQVGSCTAFAGAGAVRYQECVRIVAAKRAGQPPPAFKNICEEVLYGIERQQVLGGRVRGDGGTGAAAAQACRDYGACPRGKYGAADLTHYTESTCRLYGDRGCPQAVMAECAKHKVGSIAPVRTTDELRKGMASGYTATIASNVGFGSRGPYVRDADGCLRASGTWAHAMLVIGYTRHPSRGYLYCIQNSWGPRWVSGPRGAGDPPDGTFWCDERTMQRILSNNDSWFYDGVGGFEVRRLDWLIHRGPPANPHRLVMWDVVAGGRNDWALAP